MYLAKIDAPYQMIYWHIKETLNLACMKSIVTRRVIPDVCIKFATNFAVMVHGHESYGLGEHSHSKELQQ